MAKGEGLSPEIEKYDAQWRKDPKSRVFAQLANAYRKSGLYDEAISVCEEGLKIHPHYASAHVVLGRTYLEKGKRDKGVKELEEALILSPDNLLSLKTLGELYQQEGKFRDALDKFKKAFLLNPLDKQVQAKVDELKGLLAGHTPQPLPPLEAKTEIPSPVVEMDLVPPESIATVPPAPSPPPAPTVEASLPPEIPEPAPAVAFVSEIKPEAPMKEAEPFIILEESEDLGGELSLTLADLEEEEAPVSLPEAGAPPEVATGEEEPPLIKLEEPASIVVEEIPTDQARRDSLTTSTLGDLYLEQGFWDRAIEIYQKILEVEPDNPHIMAKIAEALARKGATEVEGAEPVYVIPEEMVPLEGEKGGPLLGELPLEVHLQEVSPPPTPTPVEALPAEPAMLFPPEELAAEVQEAMLPSAEAEILPQITPGAVEAWQAPPIMGDTTLIALEQLLTGVKKEQERRKTGT